MNNNIESIKAEFFQGAEQVPMTGFYRMDLKGKRHYVQITTDKDGKRSIAIAPSWTTLSSVMPEPDWSKTWRLRSTPEEYWFAMRNSANYGTFMHVLFSSILKGTAVYPNEELLLKCMKEFFEVENIRTWYNRYDYTETERWYFEKKREDRRIIVKDVMGFIQWAKDYKIRPIAMEYPVMSNEVVYFVCECGWNGVLCNSESPDGIGKCPDCKNYVIEIRKVASVIDLVARAEIDGKDHVIQVDYKTGFYDFTEDNAMQLRLNAEMWNSDQANPKIELSFNYGCNRFEWKSFRKYVSGGKSGVFKPYRFKDMDEEYPDIDEKLGLYIKLYHSDKITLTKHEAVIDDNPISIDSETLDIFEDISEIGDIIENHERIMGEQPSEVEKEFLAPTEEPNKKSTKNGEKK